MWGSLLALALLITVNPMRLAVIILVVSRRRPIQNLLAYWTGCLIISVATLLIPLTVLHATPALASFADNFAHLTENSTARHIAIGMGGLTLLVAALMVVRPAMLQRAQVSPSARGGRHRMPPRNGNATTSTDEKSNIPPALARLLAPAQETPQEGASAIRRLLGRLRSAWDNGALWVSFVIGVFILPPADGVLLVLAIIVASGAAMSIQISAAIVFIVVMLAVEEVILISNVVAPTKTQAALRRLHDWAVTHHRKLVVGILAVIGVSMLAQGIGA